MLAALVLMIPACSAQVEIAATMVFTEGPTMDAGGNVYFSEARGQRIYKLAPGGALSATRAGATPARRWAPGPAST